MRGKILGFRNFKSKKGQDLTLVQVVQSYSDRELANGSYGMKSVDVFLPENQVGTLGAKDIDKECEMIYEISGGRAYLVEFKVL